MQKLHLVGFTTDHEGLILSARRGARSGGYVLAIDDAIEQAVDELRARRAEETADDEPAASRTPRVESALPVREIQARLRQGRSIGEVAKAAGVEPSWIERFAAPVLAERAQVIDKVRSVPLRRSRLGPSALSIGDAVRHHLADRGVALTADEFADAWTARQVADGRWAVRFTFRYRGRDQELRFDLEDATGAVSTSDRLSGQLGYVAPPAGTPESAAERAPRRPASPAPEPRPVVKRAVVSTGFRPEPAGKPTSRSAKEREKAAAAMRRAAAKRAAESERAAARLVRERREAAARQEREATAAARQAERDARAAAAAKAAQKQAKGTGSGATTKQKAGRAAAAGSASKGRAAATPTAKKRGATAPAAASASTSSAAKRPAPAPQRKRSGSATQAAPAKAPPTKASPAKASPAKAPPTKASPAKASPAKASPKAPASTTAARPSRAAATAKAPASTAPAVKAASTAKAAPPANAPAASTSRPAPATTTAGSRPPSAPGAPTAGTPTTPPRTQVASSTRGPSPERSPVRELAVVARPSAATDPQVRRGAPASAPIGNGGPERVATPATSPKARSARRGDEGPSRWEDPIPRAAVRDAPGAGAEPARALFRQGLVEQVSGDVPAVPATAGNGARPDRAVPPATARPRRTRPLRAT